MNAPIPPLQFDAEKRYASKLEAALDAARRGFRVFPLLPDSKKPPAWMTQWQYGATRDEAKIREWFDGKDWNIAGSLDGLGVADIDLRHGGKATFEELRTAERLDEPEHLTLVARTHSGGFHLFYRLPEGERLKSRAHTFGRGIDLKTGAGAYVVLPGSEINGREYTWHKDRPIVAMPKGLIERAKAFGRPSEKSAAAGKRLAEETDEAVERAKQWVDEHAPEAVQGERDNTAFQVAAKVYDFGVSKATAHELLLLWNDTKCEPPLELDDIERIVDSAGRNRQNPIGFVGTSSGFEAMAIEPDKRTKPDKARNFDWITAAQSASRALTQRRDWLIQDILHEDGECVLIGKPNEGKSFMVLAMLYHIAKGEKFAGRRVKPGLAIYIAAEAQGGVHARMAAIKVKYGDLDGAPFAIIAHAPDLSHGLTDARLVLEAVREIEAHFDQKAKIIAIDTLNRVMAGGDENSSKDMGAVLNAVRFIRAGTSAASLVVHHPGWTSNRARGHSSIFGAVDTELRVESGIMTVEKLRDGERGERSRSVSSRRRSALRMRATGSQAATSRWVPARKCRHRRQTAKRRFWRWHGRLQMRASQSRSPASGNSQPKNRTLLDCPVLWKKTRSGSIWSERTKNIWSEE